MHLSLSDLSENISSHHHTGAHQHQQQQRKAIQRRAVYVSYGRPCAAASAVEPIGGAIAGAAAATAQQGKVLSARLFPERSALRDDDDRLLLKIRGEETQTPNERYQNTSSSNHDSGQQVSFVYLPLSLSLSLRAKGVARIFQNAYIRVDEDKGHFSSCGNKLFWQSCLATELSMPRGMIWELRRVWLMVDVTKDFLEDWIIKAWLRFAGEFFSSGHRTCWVDLEALTCLVDILLSLFTFYHYQHHSMDSFLS